MNALVGLLPASLSGEGPVRAVDRRSEAGEAGRRSPRGRLGSLLLVAASPSLLLLGLVATRGLTGAPGDGLGATLLGVYVTLLVGCW